MEADNGWRNIRQSIPKHLLLTLKLCQSVTQGTAVISLLDGRDDCSDLAFEGLELEPISPVLLLAFGRRTVSLFLEGPNELTHQFGRHEPLLEAVQNTRFDFLPLHRRVVVAGALAAPGC